MGPAARARPSSRRSCAPTPTTSGSTRGCWSRSTSSASSGPRRWSSRRSRRARPARRPPRAPPARGASAPGSWSWFVLVLVLGALLRARHLGRGRRRRRARQPNTVEHADRDADAEGATRKKQQAARRRARVTLQIVPTGPSTSASSTPTGAALIDSQNLQAGERTRRFRGRRFRVTFGNGQARMRVGGNARSTSRTARRRSATRSGPAGARASCPGAAARPARERARASSSPAPRCCRGSSPTATGRGCPSACASAASRSRRSSIVGRPPRRTCAPRCDFMAAEGVDLVVTSGGLGPTADDLTAEVVADFAGRPLALDAALEERIWEILERLRSRWRNLDEDAIRASNRKQALVPDGRDGARAGRHRARARRAGHRPTVLVLPGPAARAAADVGDGAGDASRCASCSRGAGAYEQRIMRLFGIPESEIAALAARDRGRRRADRAARDHHLPAARGDRDRDGVRAAGRRRSTTRSRPRSASATPTRCSPTTARRSTTR